jgi:hypothetical protein
VALRARPVLGAAWVHRRWRADPSDGLRRYGICVRSRDVWRADAELVMSDAVGSAGEPREDQAPPAINPLRRALQRWGTWLATIAPHAKPTPNGRDFPIVGLGEF